MSAPASVTIILKRVLKVKEKLNIMVNFESENLILRLWFLMHRIRTLLKISEDQIYNEYNLTTEQFSMLATIKYLDSPARPTDIAQWLGRSPNSVSMIIDRMIKAGLIRRIRDRSDRRVVNVTITSKGENALKLATRVGWDFIQEILSPLSYEDRQTYVRLHETIRYEIFKYLNPEVNVEEMVENEVDQHANLMERLIQPSLPSTHQAKRRGGERGKTR
jgi:DNA-binding MarR family transcriptional regulator